MLFAAAMALLASASHASDPASDVAFTAYSPLSRSSELTRRLLSPLTALRVQGEAKRSGEGVREQSIDLANERFAVHVPPRAPMHGYSLLVFVPPWSSATVPPQWIPILDRHEMIFVTAADSGNDASVLDRREPLALLAVENLMRRYHVDPKQVYIGGFSGGARVALRLAVGYPDVFHGSLLNAGSDPIGNAQIPLPPASLFRQFQESSRLVYATGERDDFHRNEDVRSRQSLQDWCVFNVTTVAMAWKGHELADASALDRSLDALTGRSEVKTGRLAACRARIDSEVADQLERAEHLLAAGEADDARRLLARIDEHFGGLAFPRSVELAAQLSRGSAEDRVRQ